MPVMTTIDACPLHRGWVPRPPLLPEDRAYPSGIAMALQWRTEGLGCCRGY
jgi:hypothetical protein